MKKRNLNIFDAGIAFVLAFVLAQFTSVIGVIATQSILGIIGKSTAQIKAFWDTAFGYLLQAVFLNLGFILLFAWYRKNRKNTINLQKPTNQTLKYVGICVLIGIASLFLLSGGLNYFQLLLDKLGFKTATLSYELNSVGSYLISLVSLALIPAVCEELIFRGIIASGLRQKGEMFAIVLSSIMFSIFHFSPAQLIYPVCFGLILSIVYFRTNNIIFPILLHFINNALSVSIQYFSNTSAVFTHSMANLVYAIVTSTIWIWIMIYLFKDFKKNGLVKDQTSNIDTNTIKQTESSHSEKVNKTVLYGSIAIMILMYILLQFV